MRGAERASTQVKCLRILSTDLSTPFISIIQQVPIGGTISFNWFFQTQCTLSSLLSHQSCLLQHHFIHPFLRGSWWVCNCTRICSNPRWKTKLRAQQLITTTTAAAAAPPLCATISGHETKQRVSILLGTNHPKKNSGHLKASTENLNLLNILSNFDFSVALRLFQWTWCSFFEKSALVYNKWADT